MNRQILGPGLRQRDPVSLPSCRRLPRPKLVRQVAAGARKSRRMKMLRRLAMFQVDAALRACGQNKEPGRLTVT